MTFLIRLTDFYRRHGFRSTLIRCWEAIRRISYVGDTALFDCELSGFKYSPHRHFRIDRYNGSCLSRPGIERILGSGKLSEAAKSEIPIRLAAGSNLWLVGVNDELVGYGWTIVGKTIKPHYFPLAADEVHLFDFFVFPEFRGRNVNVTLVGAVLAGLSEDKLHRAHLECAAWNAPQLRSLQKTAFRHRANARILNIRGWIVVFWH